jgi:SpoVK/Ycf46/Vps4 family AAA+-type ATPase
MLNQTNYFTLAIFAFIVADYLGRMIGLLIYLKIKKDERNEDKDLPTLAASLNQVEEATDIDEFNRKSKADKKQRSRDERNYREMRNRQEFRESSFRDRLKTRSEWEAARNSGRFEISSERKEQIQRESQRMNEGLNQNEAEPIKEILKEKMTEVGMIRLPNPLNTFESLILEEKTVRDLKKGLGKVTLDSYIRKDLGWDAIDSSRRTVLNFYGPPGTGKTKAAQVVANILEKKMLHVDYSAVVGKYVGETGKNLKKIFQIAKENDAIIFLDEADSLLNKRSSDIKSPHGEYLNQEKNILMQELDKFDGVVILTTNLFANYDDALIRRIAQHVAFNLPSLELRAQLIESHIPKEVKLADNVKLTDIAKIAQGFSGGDIKNLVHDALVQCALDVKSGELASPQLTLENLTEQVTEIKSTNNKHKCALNRMGL